MEKWRRRKPQLEREREVKAEEKTVAAENADAAMDVDAIEAERATFSAKKDESPSSRTPSAFRTAGFRGGAALPGWRFDGGGTTG